MRLLLALATALLLLTFSAPASAVPEPRCVGADEAPRVCDVEYGYGDRTECEENRDSFNTHMQLSAIWVDLDGSRSLHFATYEQCTRIDRQNADRQHYSASVWIEDGEERMLLDYTYSRDHGAETCSVSVADQAVPVDPDACVVREDVHAHDVLP